MAHFPFATSRNAFYKAANAFYVCHSNFNFLFSHLKVRGTIFNELDDDKLHALIDFVDFEERFKIGNGSYLQNGSSEPDGFSAFPSKRFKKPDHTSVLEHTRLRNIGKYSIFN